MCDRVRATPGTELCSLFSFPIQARLDFGCWCLPLPSLLHWLSWKPTAFNLKSPKSGHEDVSPCLPCKVGVGQRHLPVLPSSDHRQMGKTLTFRSCACLRCTVFLRQRCTIAASLVCYQGCLNKENCIYVKHTIALSNQEWLWCSPLYRKPTETLLLKNTMMTKSELHLFKLLFYCFLG